MDQIQTVFMKEDDFVEFAETEKGFTKGLWFISNKNIHRFGEDDPKEGANIVTSFGKQWDERPYEEFYEEIKGKDLKARIWLGKKEREDMYRIYHNWENLSAALRISDLVTLSTKIPKVIAKRFTVFANQKGDRSSVLRGLVYDYVKKQMVDQADTLMFQDKI